ncbi:MFS transporter, partial [Escherichia coli]|nr:MFS transporter [Escherichia coli]
EYPAGYAFAMWTLAAGVSLLAVWLLLLTMDALDLTHFSFLPALLEVGVLVALSGVVLGGLLDYLALRKTHLT